jgi:glyoxylase-like metal-dependent hydrolase (beta-lactamase superfamily II)
VTDVAFSGVGFTISRIVVGPIENNAYLITNTATNTSLIVDAAADADSIMEFVSDTTVLGIFTTHGHWDHHQAIPAVSDALDIPFMLHPLDAEIACKAADVAIDSGVLRIGQTDAEVLHTPGHTPGSVCLSLPGVVLTGDTLFPGGPGATRFDHSSFPEIIESLERDLFVLPDTTVVLPGHGAATTIGIERPQLVSWIARGW